MESQQIKQQPVLNKALELLFSFEAEDITLLELTSQKSLFDYVLIATCVSETQIKSLLNKMKRALAKEQGSKIKLEYSAGARWALLDCGDLIIHLFEKETREFYSLERLWSDAKQIELNSADFITTIEEESEYDEFL